MSKSSNDGCGPCGACKFLRRKCVKGCIFAPYFSSEQGASHFAAVHKVFGASNVSKLLLRLPVHERLDASLTICYEAMARLKDPVYGCVGYILALQQQVENLQAELAFIQAHLSTLELPQVPVSPVNQSSGCASFHLLSDNSIPASGVSAFLNPMQVQEVFGMANYRIQTDQVHNNGDLSALAEEFVSKYLPCGRFRPPDS